MSRASLARASSDVSAGSARSTQIERDSSASPCPVGTSGVLRRLNARGFDENAIEDIIDPADHTCGRAEVLDELRRARRRAGRCGPRRRPRCRRAGSGRSTASGRRRPSACPGGARVRARPRHGASSDAIRTAISAWTGSVSWNSSTRSTGKRLRKYARASALVAQQVAGPDEEVVEVGSALAPPLGAPARSTNRSSVREAAGRSPPSASRPGQPRSLRAARRRSPSSACSRRRRPSRFCAPAFFLTKGAAEDLPVAPVGSPRRLGEASRRRRGSSPSAGDAFSSRLRAGAAVELVCAAAIAQNEAVDVGRRSPGRAAAGAASGVDRRPR